MGKPNRDGARRALTYGNWWREVRTTFARLAAPAVIATVLLIAPPAAHAARGDQHYMHRLAAPYKAFFERVAVCESHSRWHINTGNGYYGGLQFGITAWRAVGGTGRAMNATRLEQSYRAVLLRQRRGTSPWPICGGAR